MALIGFIAAVAVSLLVGGVAYAVGPRLGLVDLPDEDLKTHTHPTVPLGGAAVLAGLHVGLAVAGAFDGALLAATLLVWALGVVDDRLGLGPVVRVLGETLAAAVLVALSDLPEGLFFPIFWVVATVLVINAVNLLDGLDGIAGSVAIASLGGLWWFGVAQGVVGPHFYLVSMGAILGFLYWNWAPAKLFLGDNGAYVIGVTVTWAALRASPDGTASLVAVAIIGVPILELMSTVIRRLVTRTRLAAGDRDHSYDRLHAAGLSVSMVVLVFVVAQAVWSAIPLWAAIAGGDVAGLIAAVVLGSVAVVSVSLRRRSSNVA